MATRKALDMAIEKLSKAAAARHHEINAIARTPEESAEVLSDLLDTVRLWEASANGRDSSPITVRHLKQWLNNILKRVCDAENETKSVGEIVETSLDYLAEIRAVVDTIEVARDSCSDEKWSLLAAIRTIAHEARAACRYRKRLSEIGRKLAALDLGPINEKTIVGVVDTLAEKLNTATTFSHDALPRFFSTVQSLCELNDVSCKPIDSLSSLHDQIVVLINDVKVAQTAATARAGKNACHCE